MYRLKILVVVTCLLKVSLQRSLPESDSYVAAVVEYEFADDTTTNLNNYLQYIKEAAEQNADIIVFPELTLNRRQQPIEVPIYGALRDEPVPALNALLYHEVLVAISRAAREFAIYVVINVEEIMFCNTPQTEEYCPNNATYLFNTNVVFDRNGAVIDRYRKINLFGEPTRTPALRPDLGVFTTDFGVRFAHFICFDLQFQVPAIQVVDKLNVTDVIFTTMWFSELPYLTAVQIQEGYAFAMNVNFLAAGANNVPVGSAGSGIFSGRAGALASVMPGVPTSKLLLATVPKIPGQVTTPSPGPIHNDPVDHNSLALITDPSIVDHITQELTTQPAAFVMSTQNIECLFMINMTNSDMENDVPTYRYRAAVFDGIRSYSGVANGYVRACSVIACTGNTVDTCGKRFPNYHPKSTAVFHELTIIATVATSVMDPEVEARDTVFFPLSLDTSIMPLEPEYYTYSEDRNGPKTTYSLFLDTSDRELYSFAVWGRAFSKDNDIPDVIITTEDPDVIITTEDPDVIITTEDPDIIITTEDPDNSDTTVIDENDDGSSITHLITKTLLIPVLLLLLK